MISDGKRQELKERQFSDVFYRLVRSNMDIRGFVAYGLYKFAKISHIDHNKIETRLDGRLNSYDPDPNTINMFRQAADEFLDSMNFKLAAKAAESVHSKHLDDFVSSQADLIGKIEKRYETKVEDVSSKQSQRLFDDIKKLFHKSFWPNVRSSISGSVILAALVGLLPLGIWLTNPDYRQFVETRTISLIANLSDSQTTAIDTLIDDLDGHQRQRVLATLVDRAVAEAQEPMEILKTVLEEVDYRLISDQVNEEIVAIALRKTQDREGLLRIFWQEMQRIESAAPPVEQGESEQE